MPALSRTSGEVALESDIYSILRMERKVARGPQATSEVPGVPVARDETSVESAAHLIATAIISSTTFQTVQ
jgi:hypothetical protein